MNRRRLLLATFAIATGMEPLFAQQAVVARVSALATGRLLLNGAPTTLAELDAALAKLRQENGIVCYFRENSKSEPTNEAMAAIKLIIEHRLPVSMSSKPDFSDYVDENGQSKPRKP